MQNLEAYKILDIPEQTISQVVDAVEAAGKWASKLNELIGSWGDRGEEGQLHLDTKSAIIKGLDWSLATTSKRWWRDWIEVLQQQAKYGERRLREMDTETIYS